MIKYVLNRQIQQTPLEMFAINGSMCSDKATIAYAFNEYFTNLGPAKYPTYHITRCLT